MTRDRVLTQRTEDCHWSVPACTLNPMADWDDEFESFWGCERSELPRRVAEAECAGCRHWSRERGPATDSHAA